MACISAAEYRSGFNQSGMHGFSRQMLGQKVKAYRHSYFASVIGRS
jgi:hypothetical protein